MMREKEEFHGIRKKCRHHESKFNKIWLYAKPSKPEIDLETDIYNNLSLCNF